MTKAHIPVRLGVAAALALALAPLARAGDGQGTDVLTTNGQATGTAPVTLTLPQTAAAPAPDTASSPVIDYFAHWFDRVDKAQAEQPHWMTPLVTVTPRLEQEFRYDQYFETLPSNKSLTNYGGGKGLELIPSENTEVILGIPPYIQRDTQPAVNGFGDWPAFLVKYRLLSANEQNGNYIVTAFLQTGLPTGAAAFTTNAYVVQPTIAFGKGWGIFDFQMTLSQQYPLASNGAETKFGKPVLWNTTLQAYLWDTVWPEVELNETWWPDGPMEGKIQTFVTPGVIFGRFPIHDRLKLVVGIGYQYAVSPETPAYKNNVILTVRTPF